MSENNPYAPQENTGQQPANPYGAANAGQPDSNIQQGQNGQFNQPPYGQQPYGQAPNYAQQPYTQPYGGMVQPTSGLAIAALVTGLLGMGLIAVVLGHLGLNDVKKNNKSGRGLALAGLILGYVVTALIILWVVLIIVAVANDPSAFDVTYDSTF